MKRLRGGSAGQASVLMLCGLVAVAGVCAFLAAVAMGITGKSKLQQAADVAALAAGRQMLTDYPKLFVATDPDQLPSGGISRAEYGEHARETAKRVAIKNGAELVKVSFVDADALTPVHVRVQVGAEHQVSLGDDPEQTKLEATAEAVLEPGAAADDTPTGDDYPGPFAVRQGEKMRPDVALAFDRMYEAGKDAGLYLLITSAFRSTSEQARLFSENPDPKWVAPPGQSLHRFGTELDLGPPAAFGWLAANCERFGFTKRYSWEPWHFGYTRNPSTTKIGYGGAAVTGQTGHHEGHPSLPSFVPSQYVEAISKASQRWQVSAALIAAQIMAESNFDPNAVSGAGAQGIAQFMPGTARAYGLMDPFNAEASIDAQAHLMHDLLKRYGGEVRLALAAYNAGPGNVDGCRCVPPIPETQAYVARILGLLKGLGGVNGVVGFTVRLVA